MFDMKPVSQTSAPPVSVSKPQVSPPKTHDFPQFQRVNQKLRRHAKVCRARAKLVAENPACHLCKMTLQATDHTRTDFANVWGELGVIVCRGCLQSLASHHQRNRGLYHGG